MRKIKKLPEKRTINETGNPNVLNIIFLRNVEAWMDSHGGLRY